jgi:hypothetical protein
MTHSYLGGHIFLKSETDHWPIPLKKKKKEEKKKRKRTKRRRRRRRRKNLC